MAKAGSGNSSRKATAVKTSFTKSQLLSTISENTGLTKKEVASVLEELGVVIERHVKKRSVGQFTLPGLLKIKRHTRPATKARMGRNPRTGEEMMFAAKPAHTVVKVMPLKALKEMIL